MRPHNDADLLLLICANLLCLRARAASFSDAMNGCWLACVAGESIGQSTRRPKHGSIYLCRVYTSTVHPATVHRVADVTPKIKRVRRRPMMFCWFILFDLIDISKPSTTDLFLWRRIGLLQLSASWSATDYGRTLQRVQFVRASTSRQAFLSYTSTLAAGPLAGSVQAVLSHALSSRNGHLRPLKVIRCCVNRHDIYNFLSALTNSNLTSILTVFEISRLVCIYPYPTSLLGGTGKRRLGLGGHALMSGYPETLAIQQ